MAGVSVTRADLLNLVQVATSSTSSVRVVEAVRLRCVEMWSNPSALGAPPVNLNLEWLGENSPSTVVSDVSMGVRPAHVRTSPPAATSNRWWSMTGSLESDSLFLITLAANSVVDVTVDLRLVEKESPTAGDATSGLTLGQFYGGYLDGLSSGKLVPSNWTPVS